MNHNKKIKCYICNNYFLGSKFISNYSKCFECKNKGIKINKKKNIKCSNCKQIITVSKFASNDNSLCIVCKKQKQIKKIKCCKCEEFFLGSDFISKKTNPTCPECKTKKKNIKCSNCSKLITVSKFASNDNSLCIICKIKKIKCNICKKEFTCSNYIFKNNNPICPECKNLKKSEKYKKIIKIKCYNCKKEFTCSNYIFKKTNPICPECKNLKKSEKYKKIRKIKCYNCVEIFESFEFKSNLLTPCPHCKEKGFNRIYSEEKRKVTLNKTKKTCLKNLGVDNVSKSPKIKNQKIESCLENHNVEFPSQVKHYKEKSRKTCLKNLGVDHPSKSKKIQKKSQKTFIKKYFLKVKKVLINLKLEFIDKEFFNISFLHNWKCLKCNNVFKTSFFNIKFNIYKCPTCYPRNAGPSYQELEILEFIKFLNITDDIQSSNRKIIKPLELDIYIPDKKLAIEFNGLHWHSEEFMSRDINEKHSYTPQTYHLYKTEKCLEKGIQLIHIFEDEWIFKQDIVKSRLKQILGSKARIRIHARKCIIKEISPKIKNEFLEKFHIQGPDSSRIKLGAFYEEDLISVMTFSKGNISKGSKNIEGVWELNRFCSDSNFHIPGIAGKLLSHFKKNYDWKEIFSYADRRWSQGNLYYKLGFELLSISRPNYWYLKDSRRIHRFTLRKRPDEPKDISERILRLNEGYGTIWDCGSLKFKLLNKK